jgi:hypothetical protein
MSRLDLVKRRYAMGGAGTVLVAAALSLMVLDTTSASAQNWSFDARKVGLGSPTGGDTVASRMIEDEREYRTLVLPFGLIQVFQDFKTLNPSNDEFDLVRLIEYSAAPIHFTIGRDSRGSMADDFIADVGNGELRRDLNDYKGFIPVNQPPAAGLASPNWGKTFKVRSSPSGSFQGVYIGAGPYLSMRTAPAIDDRLIEILSDGAPVYVPNAQLAARNTTQGQLALAITGGYRGRFGWPTGVGRGTAREGLYIGANYNYLRGYRYQDLDFRLRMDTDRAGLVTVNRLLPPPLLVTRNSAESGTGMALDLGVGAVIGPWELGLGANGLGNRINWTGVEQTTYFHTDLVTGAGDLIEGVPVSRDDVRVELPVDYRTNVGYDAERWAAVAEFNRGLQGKAFHGGGEYRFGPIDVRGGAVYVRELWNPATGIGIHLSQRTALDVAVYSNSANVERKRNPAVAFSFRFNRQRP